MTYAVDKTSSLIQQTLNSIAQTRAYLEDGQVIRADRHLEGLSRLLNDFACDVRKSRK